MNLDVVLGLSVAPTALGWVLAEGHGADGSVLDHREVVLRAGRGVRAVRPAKQMAAEVLRVDALTTAADQHLRVIGVTWNDESAAQAALLVEALAAEGFDNVVPVRYLDAVNTLAQTVSPVNDYRRVVVCVPDEECATVVLCDTRDGSTRTAVESVPGGPDGLTRRLTGMFARNRWRPEGVALVGSDDVDALARHLGKTLPVPVFTQASAEVTVARGAALTAAACTEFTDDDLLLAHTREPERPRQWSYAGALTAMAAGAVVFVSSLSLAVGMQLAPHTVLAAPRHAGHARVPQVAEAVTPVAAAPRDTEPPATRSPNPSGGRVLKHIPGDAGIIRP